MQIPPILRVGGILSFIRRSHAVLHSIQAPAYEVQSSISLEMGRIKALIKLPPRKTFPLRHGRVTPVGDAAVALSDRRIIARAGVGSATEQNRANGQHSSDEVAGTLHQKEKGDSCVLDQCWCPRKTARSFLDSKRRPVNCPNSVRGWMVCYC